MVAPWYGNSLSLNRPHDSSMASRRAGSSRWSDTGAPVPEDERRRRLMHGHTRLHSCGPGTARIDPTGNFTQYHLSARCTPTKYCLVNRSVKRKEPAAVYDQQAARQINTRDASVVAAPKGMTVVVVVAAAAAGRVQRRHRANRRMSLSLDGHHGARAPGRSVGRLANGKTR